MTDHDPDDIPPTAEQVGLDSAAAVEVAAFCWPDRKWSVIEEWGPEAHLAGWHNADEAARAGFPYQSGRFGLRDWDDLHRAAAVLVERGFKMQLGYQFKCEYKKSEMVVDALLTLEEWIVAAPADAWARAILATVREAEVAK